LTTLGYCCPDKTRFSLGPCIEETHPGAAQKSIVKTSPGEAKAYCVDNSEFSTSICRGDKYKSRTGTAVQTRQVAA
jgi:hypothetical protein